MQTRATSGDTLSASKASYARCRRDLCWNWCWRDLRRDEVTASCGEVNELIRRLPSKTLPAVDFAPGDLASSRARKTSRQFPRKAARSALDPPLELFMESIMVSLSNHDRIQRADRFSLAFREAREGELS
jgi:hypothetical protein